MIQTHGTNFRLVRLAGGVAAAFSLVIGLLVMYVLPSGCSFVGAIQLLILSFLFLAGLVCFLLGHAILWRRARS